MGVPNSPQLLQGQDRHVEDLLLCIERRTESVVSIRHHSARCVVTSDVEICWIVMPVMQYNQYRTDPSCVQKSPTTQIGFWLLHLF